MDNSQQAVLSALAEWFSERFRRAYRDEDVERMAKGTLKVLREYETEEPRHTESEVYDMLSRENLTHSWKDYFPSMYSALEEQLKHGTVLGIDPATLDDGIIDTYIRPYEAPLKKLGFLVDRLRTRFDEVFPEELSWEDIGRAFKEEYPRPQEYAEMYEASIKSTLLLSSFKVVRREMGQEEYIKFKKMNDAQIGTLKEVLTRMFADLYESTGETKETGENGGKER